MHRRFWDINEGRQYLASLGAVIGRSRFYHLVKTGRIPSIDLGRLYVVDLDEWIETEKQSAREKGAHVSRRAPAPVASHDEIGKIQRPRFGGV